MSKRTCARTMVLAAAAMAMACVPITTACESSAPAHSSSYDDGYRAGSGFHDTAFVDPGTTCGILSISQSGGDDENEWLKGCTDALGKQVSADVSSVRNTP